MSAIGFMTADTFIDNTGETAYTQTATLNMYFSNQSGTGLVKIPVKVTYDAAIPIEQLTMEQLIKGPDVIAEGEKRQLLKTIPDGTKINKISVKENTCYLDLSSDFLEKRSNVSDDVTIYSVVNTLVELSNINKLQFSIDGEQVLLYDDRVSFGEPFESNLDIVTQ
jgi:germination protein M